MEPTSRLDAVEVARMHMEEDAVRYIRQIEALVSTWDGSTAITFQFAKNDAVANPSLVTYLASLYREAGWTVEARNPTTYNGYVLILK